MSCENCFCSEGGQNCEDLKEENEALREKLLDRDQILAEIVLRISNYMRLKDPKSKDDILEDIKVTIDTAYINQSGRKNGN